MKTICKRTLVFLLCVLLLCGALPFAASAADVVSGNCGKDGDNVTWTLDLDTGALTISGTGEMKDDWCYYEGYPYRSDVKTVTIENGVTNIGDFAFNGCESLTSVTIPDSVTTIGDNAFCDCTSLTSVTIPGSVTSIGYAAFGQCTSLTSITIGNGVTTIGDIAFYSCRSLTSVTIPDSVTTIGGSAFVGCLSLSWAHIPASVTQIGNGVFNIDYELVYICSDTADCFAKTYAEANGIEFRVCDGHGENTLSGSCGKNGDNVTWTLDLNTGALTINGTGEMADYSPYSTPWYSYSSSVKTVTIGNGVTTIGDNAFLNCTHIMSVTVPGSVTSIGDYAFEHCTSLTGVTIPDNVTSIGTQAFCVCENLADVNIPDSVITIGDGAFSGCLNLTSVTVNKNNTYYSSDEFGALYNKEKSTLIQYPVGNPRTSFAIPDGVTTIGDFAFYGCTSLAGVTIPDSVTTISMGAFYGCTSLASVTIPDSVTTMDIPFSLCTSLVNITVDAKNAVYSSDKFGVLYNKEKSELIQYPIGNPRTSFAVPNSVTSIGEGAFVYCMSLENVTIPDSVTNIGGEAFGYCTNLSWVHIPASVTKIGGLAFSYWNENENSYCPLSLYICSDTADCYAKTYAEANGIEFRVCYGQILSGNCGKNGDNVTWTLDTGTGVLTISGTGEMADYPDYGLVYDPEIDGSYGSSPWYSHNTRLWPDKIVIESGVTGIGIGAFAGLWSTDIVIISDSVISIGKGAFFGCRNLTNVIIPDGVTSIGDNTFYNCSGLTGVTIPNSVTTIGNEAFIGCTQLTSVTIPNSVTSIGDNAFKGCRDLKSVTIPNSVTSIGDSAFDLCINLTSVTIPNSVTSIGHNAFALCVKITSFKVNENNAYYCSDEDGILYNRDKTTLYYYPAGNERTSFTIPNSVTTIGDYAFAGCGTRLTSVTIPNSVAQIGDYAFCNCFSFKYLHIPASVEKIGQDVASGCSGLQYICSDTSDCYAKTYAEENGIEFRVCDGHGELGGTPVFHGDAGEVKAECPDGTFSEETYLRVSQDGSAKDPLAEFGVTIKGFAFVQQLYYIHVQNEQGEYVQPNTGHKVTLRIPAILDSTGKPYPIEIYGVYHIDSETGSVESFRTKRNNLRLEDGYLVFEVSRFSPFIVTVEQDAPSIKMQDTKLTLPYGEKRTLTADVENLPDGAKIVWTADNDSVTLTPSADGKTCEVSAQKNGKVTVTATVIDKDGNSIEQDGETVSVRVTLQTKANIFHKLWYWIFRIPWPFV